VYSCFFVVCLSSIFCTCPQAKWLDLPKCCEGGEVDGHRKQCRIIEYCRLIALGNIEVTSNTVEL